MKNIIKTLSHFLLGTFIFFSVWNAAYAIDSYTVLAPLPGIGDSASKTTTLQDYLPAVFKLSIGIAAVMAFVMITFGGITYMTSDAISGKTKGKEYITNALWGLLLVIGAWVILNTINPKILQFTLNVQQVPTASTPDTVISGNGTGCQGTCAYSYTNSAGQIVSYNNCSNCISATSFGLNIKTTTVDGKTVQLNTALGNKLKGVKNNSASPAFTVTETWPPSVNHRDQGQYNGTAVDLSLATPNAQNIAAFVSTAQANGLTATYEVSTAAQKQAYMNAGAPATNIIVVSYITAEHFSVK